MKELKLTGGARIGRANATFPFATLKVTKTSLDLNASIVGNLTFLPSDIISIEPYTKIPLLGQGIKINHKVASYKEKVIFWTMKNPAIVIRQIQETGFLDPDNKNIASTNQAIIERQKNGGFPVKKAAAIVIVIVWNIFFLFDFLGFFKDNLEGSPLGLGAQSALGFILLTCILTLTFEPFRKLILKKGRTLNDIKKFVFFLLFISGIMFLSITFLH